jgi:hypothetical protein
MSVVIVKIVTNVSLFLKKASAIPPSEFAFTGRKPKDFV